MYSTGAWPNCFTGLRIRLLKSMAAFLAWIMNSVSGSQTDEINQENNVDKTGIANKSQQPKKSKSKEKFHSKQESPQFSTNLKSPIDEIIAAELLNIEELDSNQINNKIIRKRHKASKKSDKLISDSYSNQNTNLIKSKSDTNLQKLLDKKLRITKQTNLVADDSTEDFTNTSFIPVKEKRRFKKSKSEEKQDSVVLSKQSLKTNTNADLKSYQEQHNKNIVRHSVTAGSYKNITTNVQEPQHSKPSFCSTAERGLKESKKVVSSVSYASVTVQNFSVLEENKNGNLTEEFEIIDKPEDQTIAQEINSEKKLEEQFEFVNINTNGIINQEPTSNNDILNTIVNLEPIAPEISDNSTPDEIEIIDIRVGNTEKRSEGVDSAVEFSTNAPATRDILNNTSVKKSDLNTEDSGTENSGTEDSGTEDSSNSKRIIENIETSDSEHIILKRAIEDNIMNSNKEVRILELNDGEYKESVLYRLEKNWIIQFRLGSSLLGRKVNLYCNYPSEINGKLQKFERTTYQLLSWSQDDGCRHSDDTALFSQINIKVVGSFHYYFTYEDQEQAQHRGSGYLLVDAILTYGNNEQLPLDSIQCQTVLTKNMGAFTTWESKLKVAKESGYNMIHFTPIQELGASNSAYSLSEQLKVNPIFTKDDKTIATFDDIEKLVLKMRKEWKVVSICDIVLNHTANESKWIQVHPEVTYNCKNCSYMRPAYLLDAALYQFSLGVKKGLYEENGIPKIINTEDHLNAVRYYLHNNVVSNLKLEELFICDVNKIVADFLKAARNHTVPVEQSKKPSEPQDLALIQDPEYRRLSSTVDMALALKVFNTYRRDCYDEDSRIRKCAEDFKNKLDALNKVAVDKIKDHLNAAVENTVAGIRYFRVQSDGPRVTEISIENPLTTRYFTDHGTPTTVQEHEKIAYSEDSKYLMAHNGWVINADPLKNFAASDGNVYIRRELIAWGDSVKLRFGDKPADCPYLWDYMRKYVEQTAKIFDGVRLDNCHSTPIPVAEYLLDCARNVRPDLYVVAELFTNSDHTDNIFVNKLGITSLIREAMSAWDSHEQGRLVHRYGGYPVGSFYQPNTRPIVPSIAHALFLDLSHDNPSPILKRSVFDLLPSSALINMACCASGSTRGYDELVPHHIHVVEESREYTEWTDDDNLVKENAKYVSKHSGIIAAKRALNNLHFKLGTEGYSQVYVDQMDPDIVAVTRHCPKTHQSYILVSFTAFGHPREDANNYQRGIKSLRVEGILDEIVLEATLNRTESGHGVSRYAKIDLATFKKDEKHINGLPEYAVEIKEHIQLPNSTMLEQGHSDNPNVTVLNFKNFKPGSVVIIKISLPEAMKKAVKQVRNLMAQFSITKRTDLFDIVSKMSPADLNRAIYRCDQEEKDEGKGFDVYDIPNYGRLVYSGLQGLISLLSKIRPSNDLGHPLCGNLRDGDWLIDYVWKRLKEDQGTKELGQWLEESTKSLEQVPRYLIPAYFDIIITGVYVLLLERFYEVSSSFVRNGSALVKALSLGSLQFSAYVKSADLPTLSPNLSPPKPPTRNDNGQTVQTCTSLSAGLPHFSVGYMRNWGRDTFIALRGLYILTGRFQDARYHILGYAACLRHGLIPNLLDGGRNPRFNCRDAVWWWLYCIKCYVEEAPKGTSILSDKVSRIFPKDDSPQQEAGKFDQLLSEVIQEVLNVHFQGLSFRERNAGKQIDEHMTDNGFNVQIGVHPETGFVFGGNTDNCGTWMDKMGSSDKAGNRGKPSSPRDGSACEIVGLSKSVISWLHSLNQQKQYKYEGVERIHSNGHKTKWTFKTWADKIQDNFEKYFWINVKPVQGEIRPSLINKRGIYKDSYGASQEWADVQLRCNFPIVMVVAPELFDPKHAWVALQNAEKYLLGPLGMKTLDPEDWAYNGDYDNSNDSNNDKLAHGFNYHQGPEWVWPVGYFLRARLLFAAKNNKLSETVASTKHVLSKHYTELQSSDWRGLPELTNSNGSYCKDSSRTQAWSMSCILEVLHDLQQLEASLSDNNIKKNICRPAT